MLKNILIIGGTSGLGLEIAKKYAALGHTIFVAGRKDPAHPGLTFIPFSINGNSADVVKEIDNLLSKIPHIHTLVYAAGFYQEGHIDDLSDTQIFEMIHVGLIAPALLIRRLKNNPGKPLKVILITSSSQYTPREQVPIYTAAKSGLGMLGNSLGLDLEMGKVLVIAPSGMKTPFWNDKKDTATYLEPAWVADQIIELSSGPFKYKFAKILRDPASVEVVETR